MTMAVLPPPRSRGRRLEKVPDRILEDDDHEPSWPADPPSFASTAPPPSIWSRTGGSPPPPPPAHLRPPPPPPVDLLPRPIGEVTEWDIPVVTGPSAFDLGPDGPADDATAVIDLRSTPPATAAASPNSPVDELPAPGTLIAQNVSAWFGARKVLDRCTLQMPSGQVTAIIGPSGCGKSVFLRNLNRMHEVIPTAKMGGLITLDGVDIHRDDMSPTEVRLRIGMVFQRPNPFPSMSIKENVLAGLKLAGKKTKDADALVEWALRRGGLWNEVKDRLDTSGAALSGGQQQRLCIARSLAVRPRVLLMDEPCSALDPISTRVIEETILEIGREITIVIVTHNMQQAQRVADTCAFFMIEEQGSPGRVIEAGPTTEIFGNPQDQRTFDYVSGRFG
jgi:phosphate transport system ATP-binding protein